MRSLSERSSPTVSSALFHAEGERDILARDVAAAQADGDGHVEVIETLRMASSSSDGGAPGEAQSSISPKTMPRTPSSLPAWRSCHSMRSIW
jgi:hypothetical protein